MDYDDTLGQVAASSPPAGDANGVLTWTLPTVPPGATALTFDLQLNPHPAGRDDSRVHAPTTVRSLGRALG